MNTLQVREVEEQVRKIRIAIVGVGGAGNNVLRYLVDKQSENGDLDARYIAINTDGQTLAQCHGIECLEIFPDPDDQGRGWGAGGMSDRGKEAAEYCRESIAKAVSDCDMVLLVAGMAKGTGAGASPVIAEIAREQNALCIAMAIMPFQYEMRNRFAEKAIDELKQAADTYVLLYNERLFKPNNSDTQDDLLHDDMYNMCNDYIVDLLLELHQMLARWGTSNIDFADLRSVVAKSKGGRAVMGIGRADGGGGAGVRDAARQAVSNALDHPVLDRERLHSASGALLHLSGTVHSSSMADAMVQLKDIFSRPMEENDNPPITGYRHEDGVPLKVLLILTGLDEYSNYSEDTPDALSSPHAQEERLDVMSFYREELAL